MRRRLRPSDDPPHLRDYILLFPSPEQQGLCVSHFNDGESGHHEPAVLIGILTEVETLSLSCIQSSKLKITQIHIFNSVVQKKENVTEEAEEA